MTEICVFQPNDEIGECNCPQTLENVNRRERKSKGVGGELGVT